MPKLIRLLPLACLSAISLAAADANDLTRYVNPRQGTNSSRDFSTGNTYPAVAVPWGMNFWVAQTGAMGDGWQYTWDATTICGFKQTHQPSPWLGDYGSFSVMPVTGAAGDVKTQFAEQARASRFSHARETALPHYYAVDLETSGIRAEMTPTTRGALMRFSYPNNKGDNAPASLIVDCFDKGGYVKVIPAENKIVGYSRYYSRGSGATLPENFATYFVITADHPIETFGTWNVSDGGNNNGKAKAGGKGKSKGSSNGNASATGGKRAGTATDAAEQKGEHVGAYVTFKVGRASSSPSGEQDAPPTIVEVKIASSFISLAQAQLNFDREVAAQNFAAAKTAAAEAWNSNLRRVAVKGGSEEQLRTFYTALYHMMLFPHAFHETDAAGATVHYSPFLGAVQPGPLHTGNGFWDTFRAVHPFFTIMYPNLSADIMRGLASYYREGGWLPEWFAPGYRASMISQNSASVVADALLKNIIDPRGPEAAALWQALLKSANNKGPASTGRDGYDYYNRLGYVPNDVNIRGSVSRTLEYAYDDWCIWRMGVAMGRPASETDTYRARSGNWLNVLDRSINFVRPKNTKGEWEPAATWQPDTWGLASFTEGSSWHWTWSVFHDPQGLINAMGGADAFLAKLDSVFTAAPTYDTRDSKRKVIHEMTEMVAGNMGQYAHGNEPIQHMIYLYNYAGAPWKTQQHARDVMNRLYHSGWLDGKGLCGDEDNGQTSAWYVWSALGLYPVCPGSLEYVIGSPLFEEATLTLPNNRAFTIRARNNSPENLYIQSAKLNGQPFDRAYLRHDEILAGGELEFIMGSEPNKTWAATPAARPSSMTPQK